MAATTRSSRHEFAVSFLRERIPCEYAEREPTLAGVRDFIFELLLLAGKALEPDRLVLALDPAGRKLLQPDANGVVRLQDVKVLYVVDPAAAGARVFTACAVPDYEAIFEAGNGHDFLSALSELLDNSFEAIGDNEGTISVDLLEMDVRYFEDESSRGPEPQMQRVLCVSDSGPGLDDVGMSNFLTLARHESAGRDGACAFGAFGVGAKKAGFHLGGTLFIETKRADSLDVYQAHMSRRKLEAEKAAGTCSWNFPCRVSPATEEQMREGHFTKIYVADLKEEYAGLELRPLLPAIARKYHYVLHGPGGRPAPAALKLPLDDPGPEEDEPPSPPAAGPEPLGPQAGGSARALRARVTAVGPALGKENAAPVKRERAVSSSPAGRRPAKRRSGSGAADALVPHSRAELVVGGLSARSVLEDDEAVLLREACEARALDDPRRAARVALRYYAHADGQETMPAARAFDEEEPFADGDLHSRHPGLQVFWMGRLLSDKARDVRRLSDLLKAEKGIPKETKQLLDRIKGAVFLGRQFGCEGKKEKVPVDDFKRRLADFADKELERLVKGLGREIARFAEQAHGRHDRETQLGEPLGDFLEGRATRYRSVRLCSAAGALELADGCFVKADVGSIKGGVFSVEAIYVRKEGREILLRLFRVEEKKDARRPKGAEELEERLRECEEARLGCVRKLLSAFDLEKEMAKRGGAVALRVAQNGDGVQASTIGEGGVPYRLSAVSIVLCRGRKELTTAAALKDKAVCMRASVPGRAEEVTLECSRFNRFGRFEFGMAEVAGSELLTRAGLYAFSFTSNACGEEQRPLLVRFTLRPRPASRLGFALPRLVLRMGQLLPPLAVVCQDEYGNEASEGPAAVREGDWRAECVQEGGTAPALRLGEAAFVPLEGRCGVLVRGLRAEGWRLRGEGPAAYRCVLAVSCGALTARLDVELLPGVASGLELCGVPPGEAVRAKADLPLPPLTLRPRDHWGNPLVAPGRGPLARVRVHGECVPEAVEVPVGGDGDARFDGERAIRVVAPATAVGMHPSTLVFAALDVHAEEAVAAMDGPQRAAPEATLRVLIAPPQRAAGLRLRVPGAAGEEPEEAGGPAAYGCEAGSVLHDCGVEVLDEAGGVHAAYEGVLTAVAADEAGREVWRRDVSVLAGEGSYDLPAGRAPGAYRVTLAALRARSAHALLSASFLLRVRPGEPRRFAGVRALSEEAGAGGRPRVRCGVPFEVEFSVLDAHGNALPGDLAWGAPGRPPPALSFPGEAGVELAVPPDELRVWFDSHTRLHRISGAAVRGPLGPVALRVSDPAAAVACAEGRAELAHGPPARLRFLPHGERPREGEGEAEPVPVVNHALLPALHFAAEDAFGNRAEEFAGEVALELPPGLALYERACRPARRRPARSAAGPAPDGPAPVPAPGSRQAVRGLATFDAARVSAAPGPHRIVARDPAGLLAAAEVPLAVLPSDHPSEARLLCEPPLEPPPEGGPAVLPAGATLGALRGRFEAEDGSALEPEALELALLRAGGGPEADRLVALRLAFEWDAAGCEAALPPLELPTQAGDYVLRLSAAFGPAAASLEAHEAAGGPADRPERAMRLELPLRLAPGPPVRLELAAALELPPVAQEAEAAARRLFERLDVRAVDRHGNRAADAPPSLVRLIVVGPSEAPPAASAAPPPNHASAPPLIGTREAALVAGEARFGPVSVCPTGGCPGTYALMLWSPGLQPALLTLRLLGLPVTRTHMQQLMAERAAHAARLAEVQAAAAAAGRKAEAAAALARETEAAAERAKGAARAAGFGEVDEAAFDADALLAEVDALLAPRAARRREACLGRSAAVRALGEAAAGEDGAARRGLVGVLAGLAYVRDGELAAALQRLLGPRLEAAVVRDAAALAHWAAHPAVQGAGVRFVVLEGLTRAAEGPDGLLPTGGYSAFPGFLDLAANRMLPARPGLRGALLFAATQGALLFDTFEHALACRAARARQGRAVPPVIALRDGERRLVDALGFTDSWAAGPAGTAARFGDLPRRLDPACVRALAGHGRLAAYAALLRARDERRAAAEAARQAALAAADEARLECASVQRAVRELDEKIALSMRAQCIGRAPRPSNGPAAAPQPGPQGGS